MKKTLRLMLSAVIIAGMAVPMSVSATTSNTMNTSNTSNTSVPEIKELVLPAVEGETASEEEAAGILAKINETMNGLESFKIDTVVELESNGNATPIKGEGFVSPKSQTAYMNQIFSSIPRATIIKDGKLYMNDENQKKWFYRPTDFKNFYMDLLNLDKSLLNTMDVIRMADGGYAIRTKKAADDTASSNTSNTSNTMKSPNSSQVEILYIVDKEFRIVNLYGLTTTRTRRAQGESITRSLATNTVSEFNTAKMPEMPAELDSAEPFPTNISTPATSNTSNTSMPANQ